MVIFLIVFVVCFFSFLGSLNNGETLDCNHDWDKWKENHPQSVYQRRRCKDCGFTEEKQL